MGDGVQQGRQGQPNWYVGYRENRRWVYKASRQPTKGLCYRKEYIEACWEAAAPKHVRAREVLLKKKDTIANEKKPKMTWYQATRHSFVSRHLSSGASLDEVSAAVGHSSPVVTKRFYDHYVRRSFSPKLRAGLGLGAEQPGGRVVPMKRSAR